MMTHHLVEPLCRTFLVQLRNVILTRDPRETLPSYLAQVGRSTLHDTGYAQSLSLLHQLRTLGQEPALLDAGELRKTPAAY